MLQKVICQDYHGIPDMHSLFYSLFPITHKHVITVLQFDSLFVKITFLFITYPWGHQLQKHMYAF